MFSGGDHEFPELPGGGDHGGPGGIGKQAVKLFCKHK